MACMVSVNPCKTWTGARNSLIASFGDRATEALFQGRGGKEIKRILANLRSVALRKLDMLNAASELRDLRGPPGNRLETLKGELKGKHCIRVNQQWRVIFRWEGGDAHELSIIDYH